ncbi:dihydrofolate reductase [Yersinia kristensenii]|nr:RibD C-terminal domain [Yersinia kristensenii ATCC 33638]EEP93481.1 RibD C-terminal domain [Yersinia kristensenii ATCC 33638]PEH54451.1 dihydrofolate reductase [Yersinia kristensenii]
MEMKLTTGHVFIATSFDGFIARKDHSLDWLEKQNIEGEDYGYHAFVDSIDGVIMGRITFEKILTFPEWPYEKPVIVMSRTLEESIIPAHLKQKVQVTRLEPKALMVSLSEAGWKRAYIDGGQVIQSFIRDGLIEDLAITQVPILIGQGIPLFGNLTRDIDMTLISSKAFPSGLVHHRYRISQN